MTLDEVVAKIHKLRALAEGAGTPAEAAAASAKADALMESYQIDVATLAIERGDELTGYGHTTIDRINSNWRDQIMWAACETHRCKHILVTRKGTYKSKHDIIGHKDDVAAAIECYQWLAQEIDRLCELAWLREGAAECSRQSDAFDDIYALAGFRAYKRNPKPIGPKTWKVNYRTGAAIAITRRVLAEQAERRAKHSGAQSSALVVITSKVDELVDDLYPNRGNHRSQANFGPGTAAGQRDAADISMQRRENVSNAQAVGRLGS